MKRLAGIVLIAVSLTACGGSNTGLQETPTPIPPDLIRIENRRTEREFFTTNNIPLENCNGNRPVTLSFSRSQSTTTETQFSVGGELAAGIATAISAKIQAEYDVRNGETITASQDYRVEVDPGKQVAYQINWYETWQAGDVVIDALDLRMPFRVRTGLEGELSSGASQSCPVPPPSAEMTTRATTPALTSTPTFTPIYTHTAADTPIPEPTQTSISRPAGTASLPPPTLESRSYPCEAQIISSSPSATMFNVVRAVPSSSARVVRSIQQGTAILVLERVVEASGNTILYRIADVRGSSLGWITSEYVVLSGSCPG